MDKTEVRVSIIGIIVVAVLSFYIGYLYQLTRSLPNVLNNREAGYCPYEGAECPNVKAAMKDYQIILQDHDYVIVDGERIVSVVQRGGELDSLIMWDNQ